MMYGNHFKMVRLYVCSEHVKWDITNISHVSTALGDVFITYEGYEEFTHVVCVKRNKTKWY